MATITALEVQKRDKERVNVYLDGDYAFSVPLIEAARLKRGQMLDETEINALKTEDSVTRAVDRAVRFLSYRPRSSAEVRRNLADKATPDAVIAAAVARLERLGYLDDRAFTRFWVESRQHAKPLGHRALRYELRQKGVPDPLIDEALDSYDAQDAAYSAARQRVQRYQGGPRSTFRHKLGGFLQRRGFDYDVIRQALDRLEEEADDGRFGADFFSTEDPDD